jgi:murein DD-endopeptidase MepM/ murein hydrolase activator NlpD
MVGGVKTQGIHGHNAVDLANKLNTPIVAAAAGTVIVAKQGGWNGGYGNYVVIDHHNGVQTLYAHMNSLNTTVGSDVTQGQVIGFMGETGDATGVHVHFEVRGAVNPF